MRALLALCLLLSACAMRVPTGPGGFASGSGASIKPTQIDFIMEAFDDGQGTLQMDFPIPEPMRIDGVSGSISFHRLNGHCKNRDIASVGALGSGLDSLVIWDFQNEVDAPLPYTPFPGGIPVSTLHFQAYNDLCLPTDFRLALILHRVNP